MYTVRIEDGFAAAHFLTRYHGKCERLHGHNYKVFVTAAGPTLDDGGMLLDFGILKADAAEGHRRAGPQQPERPSCVQRRLPERGADRAFRLPEDARGHAGCQSHARRSLRNGQEQGDLLSRLNRPWTSRTPTSATSSSRTSATSGSLLPFLHGVFRGLALDPLRSTFLDPFAGSGAVSRLARAMGFRVFANDWEPYSSIINTCHLRLRPSDLDLLFPSPGGIDAVLADLNALPPLPEPGAYISRHYAPEKHERSGLEHGAAVLHQGERTGHRRDPPAHRGDVPRAAAARPAAATFLAQGGPPGAPPVRGGDAHEHLGRLQGVPQGIRRPWTRRAAPHPGTDPPAQAGAVRFPVAGRGHLHGRRRLPSRAGLPRSATSIRRTPFTSTAATTSC